MIMGSMGSINKQPKSILKIKREKLSKTLNFKFESKIDPFLCIRKIMLHYVTHISRKKDLTRQRKKNSNKTR